MMFGTDLGGTEHFEFDHPEYFDFPGDFTVTMSVRHGL